MAYGSGRSVRITLNIRREVDGVPLYFKSDGNRFEKPFTIKLQLDETYRVDITIRPNIPVESFRLQDENINLESITKYIDPNAVSYSGVWKTSNFPLTDKNKREQIKVGIELKGGTKFFSTLQCKFYQNSESQHARWGDKFNFVEYEGTISSDGSVLIQKQQTA